MKENLYIMESIMFFKRHWKQYVISFFCVLLFISGLFYYSTKIKEDTSAKDDVYSFSFVIETSFGNIFGKEKIVKTSLLNAINSVDDKKKAEAEFTVSFEESSGIFSVVSSNKKLLETLYKKISGKQVSFFDNKFVHMLSSDVELKDSDANFNNLGFKKVMLSVLVTIILTLVVGTVVTGISESKNKKVSQKFYLKNTDTIIDLSILQLSKERKTQTLINTIMNPDYLKLVVCENLSLFDSITLPSKLKLVDSLDVIENLDFIPKKVIIVCEKNKTNKQWLTLQLELSKNYSSNVECIFM